MSLVVSQIRDDLLLREEAIKLGFRVVLHVCDEDANRTEFPHPIDPEWSWAKQRTQQERNRLANCPQFALKFKNDKTHRVIWYTESDYCKPWSAQDSHDSSNTIRYDSLKEALAQEA